MSERCKILPFPEADYPPVPQEEIDALFAPEAPPRAKARILRPPYDPPERLEPPAEG